MKLDIFSYRCGVIDSFNEIVAGGVKKMAMSHPEENLDACLQYAEFIEGITSKYQTNYYLEKEAFITDLFPKNLNEGTYYYIFYKDPQVLHDYLLLKEVKEQCIKTGQYTKEERMKIAHRFGNLLSYEETAIMKMIIENNDKE